MIAESFKQQCPTCETMVVIKTIAQVGKSMECPNCKDHFVVAKPALKKVEADSGERLAMPTPSRSKPAAGKPKAAETYDVDDDTPAPPSGKPKAAAPGKNGSAKPKGADAIDDDEKPAAKKIPAKPRTPSASKRASRPRRVRRNPRSPMTTTRTKRKSNRPSLRGP